MSEQTDQLLLHYREVEDPKAVAEAKAAASMLKDKARERLRALDDLSRQYGYKLLIEALNTEAKIELHKTALAADPTAVTRAAANYYTLTMVTGYVSNEIERLAALLKGS